MNTTEHDAALTEQIARAIASADGVGGPDGAYIYSHYAAAVLPIIAAEVQAAKAEGWQEGVNFALPNAETTWYPQHNPYRAAHYPEGSR